MMRLLIVIVLVIVEQLSVNPFVYVDWFVLSSTFDLCGLNYCIERIQQFSLTFCV
jgi:hypothetical protein